MKFVYIIQSIPFPEHFYAGITDNFENRLAKHNASKVQHTSKFAP